MAFVLLSARNGGARISRRLTGMMSRANATSYWARNGPGRRGYASDSKEPEPLKWRSSSNASSFGEAKSTDKSTPAGAESPAGSPSPTSDQPTSKHSSGTIPPSSAEENEPKKRYLGVFTWYPNRTFRENLFGKKKKYNPYETDIQMEIPVPLTKPWSNFQRLMAAGFVIVGGALFVNYVYNVHVPPNSTFYEASKNATSPVERIKLHGQYLYHEWSQPDRKLLPDPITDPQYAFKMTLVIDLDKTLLRVKYENGKNRTAKRPHVDAFLEEMRQHGFEVVVFSEGEWMVESPMVDALGRLQGKISYALFNSAMVTTPTGTIKDLSLLNRPLDRLIMVDDTPGIVRQQENLITIKPCPDSDSELRNDTQLKDLITVLRDLAVLDSASKIADVRPFLGGSIRDVAGKLQEERVKRAQAAQVKVDEVKQKSKSMLGRWL